jgi:PleD family two-component response regulator
LASFGLATQLDDEQLIELIERADKALYSAKEQGRNQVQCAVS